MSSIVENQSRNRVICPSCATEMPAEAFKCPSCGRSVFIESLTTRYPYESKKGMIGFGVGALFGLIQLGGFLLAQIRAFFSGDVFVGTIFIGLTLALIVFYALVGFFIVFVIVRLIGIKHYD